MKKAIVIIGGGFAGVNCARHLQRRLPADWEIILFSLENHFVFTPLLAEVVSAAVNPLHVVWPVRQMARNVACRTAAVQRIDLEKREVHYQSVDGRDLCQSYEHLVLACGSVVKLDILPGMSAHSWPVKTVGDALALRNHIIGRLEQAEVAHDPEVKKYLLSVVIVGGGFTGVEVAGEIFDLLHDARRYYHSLEPGHVAVTLVQGGERILPELPPSLADFAHRKMTSRGIDIRLKARVQAVTERGVRLADGTEIQAGTVICAIGNTLNPLLAELGLPLVQGRLKTEPDMRLPGWPNVWSLGDCAAVPNAATGQVSPPLGQLAVRQARQLAANLVRAIRGQPTRPFHYRIKGMFASIGHRNAVGKAWFLHFSGFPAWFLWRGFYLSMMPTLARKVQIAFDWAWDLLFPRDIVQVSTQQTERLGRAHFEPGQYVFRKGDPADRFYIVEKGRAGVYPDESAAAVAHLIAGDYFGERALLKGSRRSASIRAEEPLDVITVGHGPFQDLVGHLQVLRTIMQSAVHRIEAANEFMDVARTNPRLHQVRVRDVMSRPVLTLPVNLSGGEALARCQAGGKGAYPVVDADGRMVGLCTRTDFYKAVRRLQPPETPLADIMSRPVITARAGDTLADVILCFLRHPIKRVVVVDDHDPDRPVGMLTPFDIVPLLTEPAAEPNQSAG